MARDPREQPVLLHLDKADVGKSGAQATGGEPISKNGTASGVSRPEPTVTPSANALPLVS
ncbi:MAG: hypothetical protein V7695_24525 [Sulfitobacter sp.]